MASINVIVIVVDAFMDATTTSKARRNHKFHWEAVGLSFSQRGTWDTLGD